MYAAYEDEMITAYMKSAEAFEKLKDREAAIRTYQEMLTVESIMGREEMEVPKQNLVRLGGEIPVIEKPEEPQPGDHLPMDQAEAPVES